MLDSIHPSLAAQVERKQRAQKMYHDQNSRGNVFLKMYKKEGHGHGNQGSSENVRVQCHFRSR